MFKTNPFLSTEAKTSAWEQLVMNHADRRAICNCGHAYQADCRAAGCSSAICTAREDIAKRILAE